MKVAVDVSRQTSFSHTYRDPKKGLAKRRHQIRDRKTKARARIKCPPISDSDHEWLDNAAFDVMDEDIFESVRMRRGYGRKPFVGGNDVNVDIPAPGPTRCEALQAALTLKKYVRILSEPFAHKPEVMLGSFGVLDGRLVQSGCAA